MNEQSIFNEALDRGDPAARSAYLDEACAGDLALRERVEALLTSHAEAGNFLGKLAPERIAEELKREQTHDETQGENSEENKSSEEDLGFLTPSDKPGVLGRLGHYEVLEVIGRGGMGIVLRAFDDKLHRVVAIKVMATALAATSPPRKRFLREARAAAKVRHEHVVDIHAVEDQPIPYLVMEYVSGETLQQKLDRVGPLETAEVLRLGQQIARGLAAAHAQGLIHRDIKPSNILLEKGADERVKITDFGLARAADDVSLTQSGMIAGTPMYMAPEQTLGEAIDHRADLFSLGSVLYTMCSGRPPFRATTSMATLKRVAEDQPRPIREIIPEVPQWLCDIIARLHAKKPEERFQSAKEVADLLGQCIQHLEHPTSAPLPASVMPLSALGSGVGSEGRTALPSPLGGEGSGMRGRRHRLAIAAAVLLCLISGLSLTEATGITTLRATVIRIFTPDGTLIVEVDDPDVKVTIEGDGGLVITGAGAQEVRLRPGSYKIAATRDGKPVAVDRELVTISKGGRQRVKVSLEGSAQATASLASGEIRRFLGHTGPVWHMAYSPDGRHALSRSDLTVRLWDVKSGKELRRFEPHPEYDGVAFSSDGRFAICGHPAGGIRLWEVETGKELRRFGAGIGPVYCLAFSSNDKHALSGGSGGTMILWDVQTGKELRRFRGHKDNIYSVAFSPDATQVLSGGGGEYKDGVYPPHSDHSVRLWDVKTGKELGRFEHTSFIYRVVFSPDGRLGLSGSYDGTMRLWDLRERKEVRVFKHDAGIDSVAISPDGRFALSGGAGNYISLWELDTGIRLQRYEGHTKAVHSLAVSPDGRFFLSGSWDGTMRLWQLPKPSSGQAPQPERGAFVLIGGKGVEVRKFDTLAEAVLSASEGDTIEVRGNGPFVTKPIHLGRTALTIRAGAGFRPVIKSSQAGDQKFEALLQTDARLILEGLELQRMSPEPPRPHGDWWAIVCSFKGSLHAANCRFVGTQLHNLVNSASVFCELHNCEFLGRDMLAVVLDTPPDSRFVITNCLHTCPVILTNAEVDKTPSSVQLTNNTVVAPELLQVQMVGEQWRHIRKRDGANKVLRVEAAGNVIVAGSALAVAVDDKVVPAADVEAILAKGVGWKGQGNLFNLSSPFLNLWTPKKPLAPARLLIDLADWKRFWDSPESGSVTGQVHLQGGNLLAKLAATPEAVTPAEFRLRPDSAGYRAGKDKKDLGADVDLVGPGPAYERWKKTPEYQQWLKETGQVKK